MLNQLRRENTNQGEHVQSSKIKIRRLTLSKRRKSKSKDTVQQCKETTESRRLLLLSHDGHSDDYDESAPLLVGFTSTSKLIQSLLRKLTLQNTHTIQINQSHHGIAKTKNRNQEFSKLELSKSFL